VLDEAAFLKAIAEDRDDTTRLAFADWLEERGDPRAAWVRNPAIFRWMGPNAENPIPTLMGAFRAKTTRRPRGFTWPSSHWARRLCRPSSNAASEEVVTGLRRALVDPEDHIRGLAARLLRTLEESGVDTSEDL
jgi:uncharacterized protein (TIGR02996 family)